MRLFILHRAHCAGTSTLRVRCSVRAKTNPQSRGAFHLEDSVDENSRFSTLTEKRSLGPCLEILVTTAWREESFINGGVKGESYEVASTMV